MCYNVHYSWILFPNFRRQNALHSRPKFCYPFNAFLVTHGVTKSVLYFPLLNLPAYISLPCLLNHHLQMSDVGMTTRRHITLHNASVCRLQRFFYVVSVFSDFTFWNASSANGCFAVRIKIVTRTTSAHEHSHC